MSDQTLSFQALGLSAPIIEAVEGEGYNTPTPIQSQAIPIILEKHDLMACAQTGTGKTAGFTLPLLERLQRSAHSHEGTRSVRALILTPTRELAAQVAQSVTTYGKNLSFKSAVIFGGVNIDRQINQLKSGVDIIIATPGRLLDLLSQKHVDLSKVELFVLDEADRMLDMGFIPNIRKIITFLPRTRQNLLFSATFSDEIRTLATGLLQSPKRVDVTPAYAQRELISQVMHPVDTKRKKELLSHIIAEQNIQQVLVFTRTKHGANKLAEHLETSGITSAAIHGNKSQSARTKALQDFKQGEVRVLVATDIAARGIDIDLLPYVVNYDLPHVSEDYVHRIGRTGRAGSSGKAISLVSIDEHKLLKDIETLLKKPIPSVTIEGFEPDPTIKAVPIVCGRQMKPQTQKTSRPQRNSRALMDESEIDFDDFDTPKYSKSNHSKSDDFSKPSRAFNSERSERFEKRTKPSFSRPNYSNTSYSRRDELTPSDLPTPRTFSRKNQFSKPERTFHAERPARETGSDNFRKPNGFSSKPSNSRPSNSRPSNSRPDHSKSNYSKSSYSRGDDSTPSHLSAPTTFSRKNQFLKPERTFNSERETGSDSYKKPNSFSRFNDSRPGNSRQKPSSHWGNRPKGDSPKRSYDSKKSYPSKQRSPSMENHSQKRQ